MKRRYATIAAAAAVLLFLGSCELALGPRSEGTVILNLGGGPASRAYSDAPFSGLPVFSSVTVTVSGSGMPTASQTVPGTASSVSLQVPAGPARKVEVYAAADWAATALEVPDPLPTLAKAYGGTAIVDVAGGQKVSVAMDMDVVETRIVLPDSESGYIYFASSLDDSAVSDYIVSNYGSFYFEYDFFGRLYAMSGQGAFSQYTDITEIPLAIGAGSDYPSAYSKRHQAIFQAADTEVRFIDLATDPATQSILTTPISFSNMSAIAVDASGFFYIAGFVGAMDNYIVAKFSLDIPNNFAVSTIASKTYTELGLSGSGLLSISDMTVQEGFLFITAGESLDPDSRGKLVQVELSTLSKIRDIGWSDSLPITSPTTQFYGPVRFLAIAPKKLIIADESGDIDRVIEIDLDEWEFSRIGLEDVVTFFSNYAY
jgi:hypothetical protein